MASGRRPDYPPVPDEYEPPRRVSLEEYHRLEDELPGAYEYADGLMYPRHYPPGSHWLMAGGSETHARLIVRMLAALEVHLADGPCRVYPSDMKLAAHDREFYPDVYVVCDDPMQPDRRRLEDALLICEVRSQSTADYDKGDKFESYKRLPGLREYLILDNRRQQATLFHKGDDGDWRYLVFSAGAAVPLESIGMHLPLARIYGGIILDPDPVNEAD